MRIEHSRKHGPFDRRYPPIRHQPAPASLWRPGHERLDWQGFLARFFPDSSRHDFDVLAAYESYLNDLEARRGSEAEQELPATADTERWEGEGGASAGRPRRTRPVSDPVGIR